MRLYSKTGATRIDGPSGSFTPGPDGAFDGLPDAVYADLHGRPDWENEAERTERVAAEQLEKLRDPVTMLAELQKMTAGQGALTALLANALGVGQATAPQSEPPVAEGAPADSPPGAELPAAAGGSETASDAGAGGVAKSAVTEEKPPVKSSRASKKAAASPPAG